MSTPITLPMAGLSPDDLPFSASPEADDDARLLLMVGKGDDHALRLIVMRWQAPLVNFIYRSVHDVATAEDLTQIVFVKLWRNAPHYRPEAKFSTYLFTIARSVVIGEYRRKKRKPADATDPAEMHISHSDEPARRMAEIEEAFALALESLPENQRTALLLLKQQELSYEEIAASMGATVTSVKTWIFRGRQKLRELMGDHLPGSRASNPDTAGATADSGDAE
jgi:RNA polymerase sigma-70 factor (ECF subfamily)